MPAMKARGAIVEKGEKRRKVIGDYLNNHPFSPKMCEGLMWEPGLPAMQAPQPFSETEVMLSQASPAPM